MHRLQCVKVWVGGMESVEWLSSAKFVGDQDEMHQTTGRAGDSKKFREPGERAAHPSSHIESIYLVRSSSDGSRGIATAKVWGKSAQTGFMQ